MADVEKMAQALREGFNEHDSAPTPSITPDSQSTVVVGNPNETAPKQIVPYQVVFTYAADEVTEEDKKNMVHIESTDEWCIGMEYKNVRVRPIVRTKVAALFLDICVAIGLVSDSGITADDIKTATAVALIDQTDKLAQLVQLVLGLTDEQTMHLNPGCLFDFFLALLKNEPNLKHEGNNFLSYSDFQKMSHQAKK